VPQAAGASAAHRGPEARRGLARSRQHARGPGTDAQLGLGALEVAVGGDCPAQRRRRRARRTREVGELGRGQGPALLDAASRLLDRRPAGTPGRSPADDRVGHAFPPSSIVAAPDDILIIAPVRMDFIAGPGLNRGRIA
jgi:hypothetical protein